MTQVVALAAAAAICIFLKLRTEMNDAAHIVFGLVLWASVISLLLIGVDVL